MDAINQRITIRLLYLYLLCIFVDSRELRALLMTHSSLDQYASCDN